LCRECLEPVGQKRGTGRSILLQSAPKLAKPEDERLKDEDADVGFTREMGVSYGCADRASAAGVPMKAMAAAIAADCARHADANSQHPKSPLRDSQSGCAHGLTWRD